MIESGAGADLAALREELAEKSWGGSAAVAMARPASSNRFRRVRDPVSPSAGSLPGSFYTYVCLLRPVSKRIFFQESRPNQPSRDGCRYRRTKSPSLHNYEF